MALFAADGHYTLRSKSTEILCKTFGLRRFPGGVVASIGGLFGPLAVALRGWKIRWSSEAILKAVMSLAKIRLLPQSHPKLTIQRFAKQTKWFYRCHGPDEFVQAETLPNTVAIVGAACFVSF